MNAKLTEKIATRGILFILGPMVIFHLLVLTGLIPFSMVWGGRLHSHDEMVRFEAVSILSLLTMLLVVSVYSGIISLRIKPIILKLALWFMAALFLLNTLGNLNAIDPLERRIFTPLTLLLFMFSLRLALSNRKPVAIPESEVNS